MIEGLVAALLSKLLGDFVKGLEKENLRIGILGGDITLENLELRKEALGNLNLPIAVKTGAVCVGFNKVLNPKNNNNTALTS